jgi:hypothetical protein
MHYKQSNVADVGCIRPKGLGGLLSESGSGKEGKADVGRRRRMRRERETRRGRTRLNECGGILLTGYLGTCSTIIYYGP